MKHIALMPAKYMPMYDEGYGFAELKWLEKEGAYRNFFLNAKQKMTILDNSPRVGGGWPSGPGLKELVTQYAKATELLHRPVIIAPDVVHDKDRTYTQTELFVTMLHSLFPEHPPRWMAVPQGANEDEWVESYDELMGFGPDVIGISYIVPYDVQGDVFPEEDGTEHKRIAFNRLRLVRRLLEEDLWDRGPHHLLGIKDPTELKYYGKVTNIVTNDSACAYKATRNNIRLTFEQGWPGVKDAKVLTQDEELTEEQMVLLQHNVWTIRNLAAWNAA